MNIPTALSIVVGLAVGAGLASCDARSQQRHHPQPPPVTCQYVPNGANVTLYCSNGYWHTTTPDGAVITGNGMDDPNATARGSGIVIDPGTGGITLRGSTVTAPTQELPVPAPFQGPAYGHPVPQ